MQKTVEHKPVLHDIRHLEGRLKTLVLTLETVRSKQEFEELIKIVHGPGWTTPAEYQLVAGVVESMISHAEALNALKVVLLEASKEIASSAVRG